MLKILAVTDGSRQSNPAVAHAIKLYRNNGQIDLHLLNVQIRPGSGHARMFVNKSDLEDYYQTEGRQALDGACRILDQAAVPYTRHIAIGHAAETIANFARQHGFDQIIMGTHGRSGLTGLLLGSVASDVIRLSSVPVTLAK